MKYKTKNAEVLKKKKKISKQEKSNKIMKIMKKKNL